MTSKPYDASEATQKLSDDAQLLGSVIKEGAHEAVDHAKRTYQKINDKHPGFGDVVLRAGTILLSALSFLVRPISTAVGFGVGLAFSKDVKSLLQGTNEWFHKASPVMKGVSAAMVIVGYFTPIGGLAAGMYSGHKVAEWIQSQNKA